MSEQLVVNWHITEACNFKCRYCFAHWDKSCKKELLHFPEQVEQLLAEIALLPKMMAHQGVLFDGIRLNLVGGETFLYKQQVKHVIQTAQTLGFSLSAITNGSTLDDELIALIGQYFSVIGFSVDSVMDKTNLLIGRSAKNQSMQVNHIIQHLEKIRHINANIGVKINTVVNQFNYMESLHDFIVQVNPDKWKVLKMLPVTTDELSITEQQFQYFLNQHDDLFDIISSEDNDEMTHSYLMIDPLGRFFQNTNEVLGGYRYSEPILMVGIEQAFYESEFDIAKFKQRYQK